MQTTATNLYKKSGVYALIDPRTKLVRYVGRSVNIGSRFTSHKSSKRGLPVNRWCQKLKAENLNPIITVLEFHRNPEKVEAKWIKHYRASGQCDLNLHDGGKGVAMNGGGKCEGVWSVEGIPSPFTLMIRAMWPFQNKPAGKKVTSHWREQWKSCKTELDKINVQLHCYQVVQNLGTEDLKYLSEKWAMAAAKQINEKYPGRLTLVYNDGIEDTP